MAFWSGISWCLSQHRLQLQKMCDNDALSSSGIWIASYNPRTSDFWTLFHSNRIEWGVFRSSLCRWIWSVLLLWQLAHGRRRCSNLSVWKLRQSFISFRGIRSQVMLVHGMLLPESYSLVFTVSSTPCSSTSESLSESCTWLDGVFAFCAPAFWERFFGFAWK